MPKPGHLKGLSQRRIKMRKGQQQIRCSSGVSIAGRIDSRLQIQGLPPQKTRVPRGQQQGQVPEMVKSGGDEAAPPPLGGVTGTSRQGKGALHLLHADAALLLPHDAAGLHLLLDEGLLPLRPVVALHPPDDILLLSSVATAPHLCHHRGGGCLTPPENVPLHRLSAASPGLPNAEVLPVKGDAHLHPPHLHPDTGGAPCCLLPGQAGIHDPPVQHPAVSPHPLQTAVALLGVPPVLRDVLRPLVRLLLTSGDSSPLHTVANPSAGSPAPQSHATTRDHLRVLSL